LTGPLVIPTVDGVKVAWTAVSLAAVLLAGAPWPVVLLPAVLGRLRCELAAAFPRREPSLRAALLASTLR
jgi:hypothetical protein